MKIAAYVALLMSIVFGTSAQAWNLPDKHVKTLEVFRMNANHVIRFAVHKKGSSGPEYDCINEGKDHSNAVTIFQHENYRGAQAVLSPEGQPSPLVQPGEYSAQAEVPSPSAGAHTINTMGIPDNSLSSIKVKTGYRVTLFDEAHWSGQKKEVSSNLTSVGNFNDITSSIRVQLPKGSAWFYVKPCPAESDQQQCIAHNDRIFSILVTAKAMGKRVHIGRKDNGCEVTELALAK